MGGVEGGGPLKRGEELLPFALLGCLDLGVDPPGLGHLYSALVGEIAYGFRELHPLMQHQELENRSSLFAPKAMEELVLRTNAERGGLFLVEGTQADEVPPGFLQRDVLLDYADDIRRGLDLSDNVLGNEPGQ